MPAQYAEALLAQPTRLAAEIPTGAPAELVPVLQGVERSFVAAFRALMFVCAARDAASAAVTAAMVGGDRQEG